MSFSFGGHDIGRSNVKTVLALVHYYGIDGHECRPAIEYLTKSDPEACWDFYYSDDPLIDRPPEIVFHCVAIHGDPQTGMLVGYLEYFSAHRIVVCLSDDYHGKEVHEIYAINPLSGKEISLQFQMSFSKDDFKKLYEENASFPVNARAEAMHTPLKIARKIDQDRAMSKAAAYAADYAIKNCGAKEGEDLTVAEMAKASELMAEKMMPYHWCLTIS